MLQTGCARHTQQVRGCTFDNMHLGGQCDCSTQPRSLKPEFSASLASNPEVGEIDGGEVCRYGANEKTSHGVHKCRRNTLRLHANRTDADAYKEPRRKMGGCDKPGMVIYSVNQIDNLKN